MRTCWLSHRGRSSCILFLAGWGMDPEPFRSIPAQNHDLLMAWDYREIDPTPLRELSRSHTSLHLVAWSMGVWVAGRLPEDVQDCFASAVAVNGTPHPVDDRRGIPVRAFDAMIRDFSPDVLEDFYRSMFEDEEETARFLDHLPQRSAASVHAELVALRRMYERFGPGRDIFTRRLVGARDRIFPARSQLRSWGRDSCTTITGGHFPFYRLPSWDVLVEEEAWR
ncbi:MAG: hypothetical protein Kow0089_15600 [Desulfobulbaceae bacterium]